MLSSAVGVMIAAAEGDNVIVLRERSYLLAPGAKIGDSSMHEDHRIALPLLHVMKPGAIHLKLLNGGLTFHFGTSIINYKTWLAFTRDARSTSTTASSRGAVSITS